ncbi:hypothetical protein [Amycolatopsis sp. lyj-109]|uniref:hypothetical protein n=1 Tax=Amycolatopsis sp. lyj-109 TaxID=2789287 RepID=UPI003979A9CF
MGRVHPGVDLKVVDLESCEELQVREQGRLLARASHSVTGDATAWISTNDIASIDADGYLFIHSRLDDVIVRGGFAINPAEVRGALLEWPGGE